MRPAIRYHGSKWLLAPWIIGQFPQHECYVEAYGGGAGVLLRKARSWLEIYNDLDSKVVNFFTMLRDRPEELICKINLTPYAKKEWEISLEKTPDPLESARRFYIRSMMSIAGPTAQWRTGWRRQKVITKVRGKKRMTPAAITMAKTGHLHRIAERLKGVQIEWDSALKVIERYDSEDTLFYLDPPYVASTRNRWKKAAYAHEMSDLEHRALAHVAHTVKGMVLISGYRCPLYDELYVGWHREDKEARTNGPNTKTESLWISPRAREKQLPLFNLSPQK